MASFCTHDACPSSVRVSKSSHGLYSSLGNELPANPLLESHTYAAAAAAVYDDMSIIKHDDRGSDFDQKCFFDPEM